jgi:hypothetical protein
MLDVFGGYNHNLRIGEGEFYSMKNMSSDDYPILSPRSKRGTYKTTGNPRGLISKDKLCYVDGGSFYIGDTKVENFALTDDEKTMISMGAYVVILPDKKYINTTNTDDKGDLEAEYTSTGEVKFSLAKADGEVYGETVSQDAAPESPTNGMLWVDTSSIPHTLKQYSSASAQWVALATTYIKIEALGIGTNFEAGDGVTISGVTVEALKDTINASHIIKAKAENYIVVIGLLEANATQSTAITVSRKMPVMDFIIENENRLWGCHYGEDANGNMVNEIYACKLGDFRNWNSFQGIASDSYAVTVGTDGKFTGAVAHLGYPVFFKENCMHKIYGNYPSNYQIQTTNCRGVQEGCEKSLATVNEVLYYKARGAVCAFDGSLPVEISSALGDVTYDRAVGGSMGNKYYLSMRNIATDDFEVFVYDTTKGMWHKEDDTQVTQFCSHCGDLFYIDYADNYIKSVKGQGVLEGREVQWEVITGTLGTDSPDKKYISRIDVRMKLDVGARVSFFAEYNSDGEWEHLYTMTGTNLKSFAVPIRPKRCDHMKLRILGNGEAKIYSICKTIEQGSDI